MNSLDEVRSKIGEAADEYFEIMDTVVNSYSGELDVLINDRIQPSLQNLEELSTDTLSSYALELAAMIYVVGSHVEKTGVLEDVSKLLNKETYNNAYIETQQKADENKQKMTVAQLTAAAEEASKYEATMNSIYSRIYKQLKFKLDSAIEILSTLKKVISQRMQESALSSATNNLDNYVDPNAFGGTYAG